MNLTPDEWIAVRLSLKVAAVAALASLPLAIATACALARGRFPGRAVLDGIVHLAFGRRGPAGAILESCCGIVFSFRWTGAALAAAVMAFPLMVRAIRLSLEAIDQRLEQAASTLGANRAWVFATVTLPLAAPGVIAGLILAFAKALGEFGATITFVAAIPGQTQTVPAAIYAYTQVPGGENGALRLSLIAIAIALLAVVASELLTRRVAGSGRLT